jgi:hypothetical protein
VVQALQQPQQLPQQAPPAATGSSLLLDLGIALDDPAAVQAGLTPQLVGGFAVVYENLDREKREDRAQMLRHFLSRRQYGDVVASVRPACQVYNIPID